MDDYIAQVFLLSNGHPILSFISLLALRAVAVVVPPIPGFLVDLGGIAILPWSVGFIASEIGLVSGAMVAFWIAKVLNRAFLQKYFKSAFSRISIWEGKISEKKKFWGLVLLRIPSSGIFDYMSYAAGLTTISPLRFMLATIIGSTPSIFLIYFFGSMFVERSYYFLFTFLAILIMFLSTFLGKMIHARAFSLDRTDETPS
ncbi:MAG: VTT domain-containing protein [Patescibacteria group bacterium]